MIPAITCDTERRLANHDCSRRDFPYANYSHPYLPELKGGRLALAEVTSTAKLPRPAAPKD
ncbi:hypothetical protein [Streptomyces sp. bgisy095]|uniref:hypothetical protein n=1 Tax=unclassified Streptomyces TaxID=2593676 RepID=UPI003D728D70